MRHKPVFTTGEAAAICNLSQQTIIRCFDNGQLEGFRVPGSRFRRIPRDKLIRFMKENKIPLGDFEDDRIRVLVVDDDPGMVEVLVDMLAEDGRFETATAQTGYDAGMLTKELRPDVVLLDFKLPDVNGTVVCRTIRSRPELANTKILVISGVADPAEVKTLMDAGADGFFRKPFNVEKVIERMLELVKGR